jgi:hypothetical protein
VRSIGRADVDHARSPTPVSNPYHRSLASLKPEPVRAAPDSAADQGGLTRAAVLTALQPAPDSEAARIHVDDVATATATAEGRAGPMAVESGEVDERKQVGPMNDPAMLVERNHTLTIGLVGRLSVGRRRRKDHHDSYGGDQASRHLRGTIPPFVPVRATPRGKPATPALLRHRPRSISPNPSPI